MKKIIVLALIAIGLLAMPLSVFADMDGYDGSDCRIQPFSFERGITPERFQDPRHRATAATWCDFLQIVSNIIGLLYSLVIPIAILMVSFGGITILASGGNENRLKQGRAFIKSALIGVAIASGAGILISFILRGLGVADNTLFPWLF